MNSTSLLLAVGAVAVALGLMLLFGQAESVTAPVVPEVVVVGDEGSTGDEVTQAQYWAPVARTVTATAPASSVVVYGVPASAACGYCGAPHKAGVTAPCGAALNAPVREHVIVKTPSTARAAVVAYGMPDSAPCGYCGTSHSVGMTVPGDAIVQAPAREYIVGGCGWPVSPCGRATCEWATCQRIAAERPQPTPACPQPTARPSVGSCGTPVSPCAERSCEWRTHTCGASCATPCENAGWERPGINRSTPTCVDECSYLQLHSTARHPICSAVRFEWAASRGSFLDPTASDPLYFTPTIHQPAGEEVWITLTITDATGVRYTDQIQLFIRNVR